MKKLFALFFLVAFIIPVLGQTSQNIEKPNRYKVIQDEINISQDNFYAERNVPFVYNLSLSSNFQISLLGEDCDSRLGWGRSNTQISLLGEDIDSRLGWGRSSTQILLLGEDLDSRLGWGR